MNAGQVLLLGSSNHGKQSELRQLLAPSGLELLTPSDLGILLTVDETASDYAVNARAKARAYAQATGMRAVADDSGLEVDALKGAPGPLSARLAGPGASDADRRRLLLEMLKPLARPWTARFRCLMALADPDRVLSLAEGVCAGEIIPRERGAGGFGYDPIFLVEERGRTMAELSPLEKNDISHRGRAATQILHHLLTSGVN